MKDEREKKLSEAIKRAEREIYAEALAEDVANKIVDKKPAIEGEVHITDLELKCFENAISKTGNMDVLLQSLKTTGPYGHFLGNLNEVIESGDLIKLDAMQKEYFEVFSKEEPNFYLDSIAFM